MKSISMFLIQAECFSSMAAAHTQDFGKEGLLFTTILTTIIILIIHILQLGLPGLQDWNTKFLLYPLPSALTLSRSLIFIIPVLHFWKERLPHGTLSINGNRENGVW